MIQCPLCGLKFEECETLESSCKGCPMFRGCDMVKCPNCGYEFPKPKKSSKVLDIISSLRLRIWRK